VSERPPIRAAVRGAVIDGLELLHLRGRFRTARAAIELQRDKYRLRKAAGATPLRIAVGSSGVVQSGWTKTEKTYLDLLQPGDWTGYFKPGQIDAILAEHVWEHLTVDQGITAAKTCKRYLRPGGHLRIAVPDGNHPDPEYIRYVMPGGVGPGADDHKVLYDYRLLSRTISEAGLSAELLEYFDENGRFVFNPWNASDGMIHRSSHYDARNRDGKLNYTSLIVDARAP
jgi:predicted SAM-dependent methyltransferase